MSTPDSVQELPEIDAPLSSDLLGLWAIKPSHFRKMWATFREGAEMGRYAQRDPDAQSLSSVEVKGDVAIVNVHGPMTKEDSVATSVFGGTSSKNARLALEQLARDDDVSAILLHIDSPGGTVAGTGDLADAVFKARQQKPVFAFIEDLGASAAFFVGSQATRVFANRHAQVGSIGVFAQVFDMSELFDEVGVKALIVKSAEHKGDFAMGTEVTEEQVEELQREINDMHALFVQTVARGRDMTEEEVEELADGRVHIASDAKELGLIDEVASFRSVMRTAQTQGGSMFNALRSGLGLTADRTIEIETERLADSSDIDEDEDAEAGYPDDEEEDAEESVPEPTNVSIIVDGEKKPLSNTGNVSTGGSNELPPIGFQADNADATITFDAGNSSLDFSDIIERVDTSDSTKHINTPPSLNRTVTSEGEEQMTDETDEPFEPVENEGSETVSKEEFDTLLSEFKDLKKAHLEQEARNLEAERARIASEFQVDIEELRGFDEAQLAQVEDMLAERDQNPLHAGPVEGIPETEETEPWRNEEYAEWRKAADTGKLDEFTPGGAY